VFIKKNKACISALRGFTLIELLIVIAVLAILATIVFVALNPLARYQDARNAKRWASVDSLINAIKLFQTDHKGNYPAAMNSLIDDEYYEIGTAESCAYQECDLPGGKTINSTCLNIEDLINNGYIASIPIDSSANKASSERTGYFFMKSSNKSITVGACYPEIGSNDSAPHILIVR
jgi:prepilin-type N-terminal cleavage/methylation domain-containing protein